MTDTAMTQHFDVPAEESAKAKSRPLSLVVAFNALVGLAVAAYWFTPTFLRGKTAIFLSPDGDIETYLTGAQLAIHDRWRFPLFETDLVERSVRQSLAFFDLNPLFALVAKIIYKQTGYQAAYIAWWYAIAVVMQPIAFTLVLWFMGVRNRMVLFAGGALALLVPTFLFRVGHTALFGSFTYIIAMALYFATIPPRIDAPRWPLWTRIVWPIWICLVAAVNPYLMVLCLVFFGAALIQPLVDDGSFKNLSSAGSLRRFRPTVVYGLSIGALIVFVLYAIGDLIPYRGGGEIGFNSMNILSSFVPQFASLFPDSNHFVDATGGQAEGYNYLGFGIMILAFSALLYGSRGEAQLMRRHSVMIVFLIVLTLFAISNKAYVGKTLIWSFPAPEFLGTFRNSGRFIWPVTYFVLALSLYSVAKIEARKLAVLLIVVLGLQWADTRLLASGLYNLGHEMNPAARVDDEQGLRTVIAQHAGVHVEPDFGCLNTNAGNKYIIDIAYYAALENRRNNATYQGRSPLDWVCDVERNEIAPAVSKGYLTFTLYNLNQIPKDLDRSQCALRPGVLMCMAAKDKTFDPGTIERLFSPTPAKP